MDNPERNPDYEVQDEDLEEPEAVASGSGLSQEESLKKGLPQLPKKRAVVPESKKSTGVKFATKGSKEHLSSRITTTHSI